MSDNNVPNKEQDTVLASDEYIGAGAGTRSIEKEVII